MMRGEFLEGLRRGLRGLPQSEIDDIISDYEAHFTDAMEAGRSEAEIAASLGSPSHLANELGAEARLQRWETSRNPHTFLRAGAAVIGLQAINIFILLPVLAFLIFCAGVAAYVLYLAGGTGLHLLSGLLSGGGNVMLPALLGAGMICGVVGMGALLALLLDAGLRQLARYARLNYRLLKPSDEDE
ncbi:MAG: DUF1700 domain-containing protein [Alphaproteobacteria bacterium]|nr:DUF1700 domain-containing protein [Alphaproteobacteria bacterium]